MKNKFLKTIFVLILITGIILPLYLKIYSKRQILIYQSTPQEEISSGTIGKGGFLRASLKKEGFTQKEIFLLEEALKPIFDFRKCHPDDRYEITRISGKFKSLRYYTSPIDFSLIESKESGGLIASREKVETEEVVVGVKGEIESSLYESMLKDNLTPDLIMRFADIFAWQIDFLTEPREGDIFRLIWKQYQRGEKSLLEGRILAAQYENNGRTHTAIFFEDANGRGDYYTPERKSLRKMI